MMGLYRPAWCRSESVDPDKGVIVVYNQGQKKKECSLSFFFFLVYEFLSGINANII